MNALAQVGYNVAGNFIAEEAKKIAHEIMEIEASKVGKRAVEEIGNVEEYLGKKLQKVERKTIGVINSEVERIKQVLGLEPGYRRKKDKKILTKIFGQVIENDIGATANVVELTRDMEIDDPIIIEEIMSDEQLKSNVKEISGTEKVIFSKMPNGAKRSRSKRGDSKYVTKRGVKRMLKNYATLIGDIEFTRQSSIFIRTASDGGSGVNPIGTTTLVYGHRAITSWVFDNRNAWFDNSFSYRERLQNIIPQPTFGGAEQLPSEDAQIVSHDKVFIEFMIHNPMNEVVNANMWWIRAKQDVNISPETLWKAEYDETRPASGVVVRWDEAFFDYPTRHKAFQKYYEIREKYSTVFQPGETKKLKLTMPKAKLCEMDLEGQEAYINNITHWLMMEIYGVPTGSVVADTYQPGVINYTPASLEMLYFSRTKIGMSAYDVKFTGVHSDTRGTVNAASSLIPQTAATIGEV